MVPGSARLFIDQHASYEAAFLAESSHGVCIHYCESLCLMSTYRIVMGFRFDVCLSFDFWCDELVAV